MPIVVRKEVEAEAERAHQDLSSERLLRETLQTKLSSQESKTETEEVARLTCELQKLNMRYAEMVDSEEKKCQQTVEYWKVCTVFHDIEYLAKNRIDFKSGLWLLSRSDMCPAVH